MARDKPPRVPTFAELGISEDEVRELRRSIARGAAERHQRPGGQGAPAGRPATVANGPRLIETPPVARPKRRSRHRVRRVGDPQPAPLRGLRGPLTLAALLAVGWLSSSWRSIPEPVAAGAPDTAFSSGRAMTHVVEIASEAHPPGSPAHARARAYLIGELRVLGLDPAVQTATSMRAGAGHTVAATVHNVVARLRGSAASGRAVLVTAHYDSRGIALGAGDAGAGVAAILEAVRAVRAGPALRNDLVVLFTDAEEIGLLGAQAFVREHPWMDDVAVALSFEMRGGGGPSTMFETGDENGWVIAALARSGAPAWANSLSEDIYRRMPNDTDFTHFREAGVQGLNFAGIGRAHLYHQQYDSPANLSEATLQHHGENALALLRHLGDADLSDVHAPTRAYLSLPCLGIVSYDSVWVRGVAAAAVGAWALAFLFALWIGSSVFAVLLGTVTAAVYLAAMGALGFLLLQWRVGAHPEVGALQAGLFHEEGWYILALVAAALALAMPVFGLVRRWIAANELATGALIIPAGLAVGATALVPLGAMNLQGPAIAGCVGAAALIGVRKGRRPGMLRWATVLVAAVPVLVVHTPMVEGVWLAMGMELAAILAIQIGVAIVLLLPALEVMREPGGWWLGLGATAAAAVFLALGIAGAQPSPDRPAPSTLVYALDRSTDEAWWGTDAAREASHPGSAWVAAVGPFGADSPPDSLRSFTGGRVGYATAAAEVVDAPLPRIVVVGEEGDGEEGGGESERGEGEEAGGEAGDDAAGEDGTTDGAAGSEAGAVPADPLGTVPDNALRIVLHSSVGAEMLRFEFPESGTQPIAVNGRPLPESPLPVRIEHWGAGSDGVALDFPATTRDPIHFAMIEHLLRPGEILGRDRFARPPELAPNIRMMSDRAMIRTRVTVAPESGEVVIGEGG